MSLLETPDSQRDIVPPRLKSILPKSIIDRIECIAADDGTDTWKLRFLPAGGILSSQEIEYINELKKRPISNWQSSSSHIVAIIKATRLCNLRCTYCNSWRSGPGQIMPFDVLADLTFDILSSDTIQDVDFVWHGGEVTLLPVEYMEKALWLQQHFAPPHKLVANSIQTNATRIDDKWIDLFKKYKVSVGVSIDGPPEVHDSRRVDKKGRPTSKDVERGIAKLRAAGIRFGALAVVDECVLNIGPRAYLEYLVGIGVEAVAILNALPENSSHESGGGWFSWQRFVFFLRDLYRVWWNEYRNKIVVRELEALVDAVVKGSTGICIYRENCMGRYITVDPNGDVSACDKYVGDPSFLFGNIKNDRLGSMLSFSPNLKQAKVDVDNIKSKTLQCPEYAICSGGCPHDVRLRHLHGREEDINCCGLAPLISDIRSSVNIIIGGPNA